MRILIIHNHYQHPGGEDVVFKQECALLAGVAAVATLTFRNQPGWRGAWQTLWSPWNSWAGRQVSRAIRQHRPTVIHIHNLHYAIGPIAIRIAKRHGIPVVMTLHNYRLLCPSATLFFNGQLFTDSLHARFPWKAIYLGVHSHSRLKTFWLALTGWLHRIGGTWQQVNRYLILTDFAKQCFIDSSFGVPAEKFVVKPNFVVDIPAPGATRGNYFLYIGRLTEEKGVRVLLEAFTGTGYELRIAGNGPLLNEVLRAAEQQPEIHYLGTRSPEEIRGELAVCSALVFPSIWYEGMPMTLLEAFATGTPVIASNLGAMATMIRHGENGWLFPPANAQELRKQVTDWLATDQAYRAAIGRQARHCFEQHYTESANRTLLMEVYREVMASDRRPEHGE